MRKLLALLIAITVGTGVMLADVYDSGTCGANLTWTLDYDGILTISGTGAMYDYTVTVHSQGDNRWVTTDIPWPRIYVNSIVIEEGVTYIGKNAFNMADSWTPNASNSFYDMMGYIASVESVSIPSSVTSIGLKAFEGCNLTSIEIPNSVLSIGNGAFANCTSMVSATLGTGITTIPEYAFYKCNALQNVNIGENIETIYDYAFKNCSQLATIYNNRSIPSNVYSTAFDGVDKLSCILYVPENSIDTYNSAAVWRDFSHIQAIQDSRITVRLYPNATPYWTNVHLYAWTEIDNVVTPILGDWPGMSVYKDIEGWWSYTFAENIVNVNLIWNNGESGESQTNDVLNMTSSTCMTLNGIVNGKASVVEIDCNTPIEEPLESTYNVIYIDQAGSQLDVEPISLHLPEAPQIDGFTFIGWQPVATIIEGNITLQAIYESISLTSTPTVVTNPVNPAQKLIRNGNVYVLTSDKTYTVTGQEVR